MADPEVAAWERDGHAFERYAYAPGRAGTGERHAHAEYQVCLSEDFPGRNHHRGATVAVPVGAVSLMHPGEAHSSSDPFDRETVSRYRLLYLDASSLARALDLAPSQEPFFETAVVTDPAVFEPLRQAHVAAERRWPQLEREALLRAGLRTMAAAMGVVPAARPEASSAAAAIRDRIHADLVGDLSLRELALAAGYSEGHLVRAFHARYGMPPHAYQIAIRVERAKRLLLGGMAPARVAAELGFADQAHFTRRFKRIVGVTPGRYRSLA